MSAEVTGRVEPYPITQLVTKTELQMRAHGLDGSHVAGLIEAFADAKQGARSWPHGMPPIRVVADGVYALIVDGHHRAQAAREAGLKECLVEFLPSDGMEPLRAALLASAQANATQEALPRRPEDKRRAVAALLTDGEWGKWSDRAISDKARVSPTFVGRIRAELKGQGLTVHVDSERTYTTKHGTEAVMNVTGLGEAAAGRRDHDNRQEPERIGHGIEGKRESLGLLPPSARQASTTEAPQAEPVEPGIDHATALVMLEQAHAELAVLKGRNAHNTSVTTSSSETPEHYTPARYIEAARRVMGGIDTDPATCRIAQKTVKAAKACYMAERGDDGLADKAKWPGKVWLNPPFKGQDAWVLKAIAQEKAGIAEAVTLLVKVKTEQGHWRALLEAGASVCWIDHRIAFDTPEGPASAAAPFPCLVAYLGIDHGAFAAEWAQFGPITRGMVDAGRRP